jgi:lipoprotein-anchoring transpeptidase ErfK/SrfK
MKTMCALRLDGFAALLGTGLALAVVPAFAANQKIASLELRGTVDAERPAPMVTALIDEPDAPPEKKVIARVDLSDQRMYVYVENRLAHVWKVSSGIGRYGTPRGTYRPEWMVPMWRSRKYNMAPMPWSVFFHEGYAVHGTTDRRHLGRAASHGCVRLDPANAKAFYRLVAQFGMDATLITVVR